MRSTILIIEDNEVIGHAMSQRLRSFGFDVLTATDVAEADEMAAASHPDVVFMDMRFTNGDVSDAGRELAKSDWATDVPFVLVADAQRSVAEQQASDMGACGMLAMPFSGNDLLDSVSDALWHEAEAANDPVAG